MFAIAQVLMVALALTGVAGTGVAVGVVHVPMQKAIDIHQSHLVQNSTIPTQSQQGQQTALNHLLTNQGRFITNHKVTHIPNADETEQNETD